MPPVKVFWHDARSDAAYKPPRHSRRRAADRRRWRVRIGRPGRFRAAARSPAGSGRAAAEEDPDGWCAGRCSGAAVHRGRCRGSGRTRRSRRRRWRRRPRAMARSSSARRVSSPPIPTPTTSACCRWRGTTSIKLPPQMLTRSPGHHRDWLRACRGGDPACSNFSVAGPFTEWIVLGALALHFEGKLGVGRCQDEDHQQCRSQQVPETGSSQGLEHRLAGLSKTSGGRR